MKRIFFIVSLLASFSAYAEVGEYPEYMEVCPKEVVLVFSSGDVHVTDAPNFPVITLEPDMVFRAAIYKTELEQDQDGNYFWVEKVLVVTPKSAIKNASPIFSRHDYRLELQFYSPYQLHEERVKLLEESKRRLQEK